MNAKLKFPELSIFTIEELNSSHNYDEDFYWVVNKMLKNMNPNKK